MRPPAPSSSFEFGQYVEKDCSVLSPPLLKKKAFLAPLSCFRKCFMDNHRILASCLEDVLLSIKPDAEDRLRRERLIRQLAYFIQKTQGSFDDVEVVPFGSYASNLYSKSGDLDITAIISESGVFLDNDAKHIVLSAICENLEMFDFGHSFQLIPTARVPILMLKSDDDITCDISINNFSGCIKSKMLRWISEIDGRFRDLVLVIKEWAKAHNIKDPKSRTFSSYALCLLVIFHLQSCMPPILPPLKTIYSGNVASHRDPGSIFHVKEQFIQKKCAAAIAKFKTENKDSLSELVVSFFGKFSGLESIATQCVFSTYSGKWERVNKRHISMWGFSTLKIEDPFDQKENASHTVSREQLPEISSIFSSTYERLSSSDVLSNKSKLMQCLFKLETKEKPLLTPNLTSRTSSQGEEEGKSVV